MMITIWLHSIPHHLLLIHYSIGNDLTTDKNYFSLRNRFCMFKIV
jgi:hypothetical protein